VKSNADSLSSASRELSVITLDSAGKTTQQRDQTHMVATAMQQLSLSLKQVLQLTETVAAATEEQDQAFNSVVVSVKNMSDLAGDVEAGSKKTNAAAENLAEIAAKTRDLVDRFKV
jgi:methyl-accepting chemotaxis protein